MKPTHAKYIMFGILFVLFVFSLGLLAPLLFQDLPKDAGSFGDQFGWVSALFNGFGFIALTYTIILQLDIIRKDDHHKEFIFLYGHIETIEKQFQDFNFNSKVGLVAFDEVKKYVSEYKPKSEDDVYVIHLIGLLEQMKAYRDTLIQKRQLFPKYDFDTLRGRYFSVQSKYVLKLKDTTVFRWQEASSGGWMITRAKELIHSNLHLVDVGSN